MTVRAVPLAEIPDAVGRRHQAGRLLARRRGTAARSRPSPRSCAAARATSRCCSTAPRASARSPVDVARARRRLLRRLGPEVALRPGRLRHAVGRAGVARRACASPAPAYGGLADPAARPGQRAGRDARRHDTPLARPRRSSPPRSAAFDVLADAGLAALSRRARARAGRAAGRPRCAERRPRRSSPRGDRRTLVAWAVADDDEAVAARDRLAGGRASRSATCPAPRACARRSARGTTRTTSQRLLTAPAPSTTAMSSPSVAVARSPPTRPSRSSARRSAARSPRTTRPSCARRRRRRRLDRRHRRGRRRRSPTSTRAACTLVRQENRGSVGAVVRAAARRGADADLLAHPRRRRRLARRQARRAGRGASPRAPRSASSTPTCA